MKEEALKLADELQDYMTSLGWETHQAPNMIRRLVAENNFLKVWRDTWAPHINPLKQTKPLSDEEIMSEWEESKDEIEFARAILRKAQEK